MLYVLEMRSTQEWSDVRYREYTKSIRKAEHFKTIPKLKFTDSGHGIVPHVAAVGNRRAPSIRILREYVDQHMIAAERVQVRHHLGPEYHVYVKDVLAFIVMGSDERWYSKPAQNAKQWGRTMPTMFDALKWRFPERQRKALRAAIDKMTAAQVAD